MAQAKRLVVSETDGLITANIHVRGGAETRKIQVNVVGEDGKPYASAYLSLSPRAGFPLRQSDGVYAINLFAGTDYEITAHSFCVLKAGGLSKAAVSAQVQASASEMTLVMPGEPCAKQKEP